MTRCTVPHCKNRTFAKNPIQKQMEKTIKITFHRIPRDTIQRSLWFASMGISPSLDNQKNMYVCSEHFYENDFDRSSVRTRLKANAVPHMMTHVKNTHRSPSCEPVQYLIQFDSPVSNNDNEMVTRLLLPVDCNDSQDESLLQSLPFPLYDSVNLNTTPPLMEDIKILVEKGTQTVQALPEVPLSEDLLRQAFINQQKTYDQLLAAMHYKTKIQEEEIAALKSALWEHNINLGKTSDQ